MLAPLPSHAAFRHESAREGFEITCFRADGTDGEPEAAVVLEGGTTAVEEGVPWTVTYRIVVDGTWHTRRLEASCTSISGSHRLLATRDDDRWTVNGAPRPDLHGCVDVDLESSLVTNTLPLHRLDIADGATHDSRAAYVRADDLRVEIVEQTYRCTHAGADGYTFAYTSTTFDTACDLTFDASGLVVDYPGLGRRYV